MTTPAGAGGSFGFRGFVVCAQSCADRTSANRIEHDHRLTIASFVNACKLLSRFARDANEVARVFNPCIAAENKIEPPRHKDTKRALMLQRLLRVFVSWWLKNARAETRGTSKETIANYFVVC
jgi:hypothetical protein